MVEKENKMIQFKTWEYATLVALFFLMGTGFGILQGWNIWDDNTHIAPTYALDEFSGCGKLQDGTWLCPIDRKDFNDFWQEATKNTQFTIDGRPVQITDVQIFYRTDNHCTLPDTEQGTILYDCKCYKNGNITYYPLGIENSQTYIAPTPTPCMGITCNPNCPTENQ